MTDKPDPVNPKLKEAMEEIKTLLRRHNVAAFVALCSGEQSEYLNWIAAPHGPTWSALLWEPNGIRLRAKAAKDFAERFKLNSTVKMAHTMQSLVGNCYVLLAQVCKMMDENLDLEHGAEAHRSHDDYLKERE